MTRCLYLSQGVLSFLALYQLTLGGCQLDTGRGLHTAAWDPIFSVDKELSRVANSTLWTGTRKDAFARLADGTAPFFIDYLPLQPDESLDAQNIVATDFATAGLCVAFNIGQTVRLDLTTDQLALLLMGNSTALVTPDGGALHPEDFTILLPAATATPILGIIATAVADSAVVNFSIATVLANPQTQLVQSDMTAVSQTKTSNMTMTVTGSVLASKAGLPCLQINVPHKDYPTISIRTSPATFITERNGDYPLVQRAYLFASVPFSCTFTESNRAYQLVETLVRPTTATTLNQWNIKTADTSSQLTMVRTAFASGTLCGAASIVPSSGSSAILPLAEAWSIQYLTRPDSNNEFVFVDYAGGGSGTGLRNIKAEVVSFAGSDSEFTAGEYEQYPLIQFVPATAFAVSIIANVPGISGALILTRCVTVAIFTGKITFWDHPLIVLHNPSVLLPHVEIKVFARSTRSGTTGIFLGGLEALNDACAADGSTATNLGVSLTTPVNATSTWNLFFPTLELRTSTGKVVAAVKSTPYSVGYASHGAALLEGLTEATFLDDLSALTSAPTEVAVTAALDVATLHAEKLTLQFAVSAAAYPMVGITYFVYHNSQEGNCTLRRDALDFLLWTSSDAAGKKALALNYVPLPPSISQSAISRIRESTCDGEVLYPSPVHATRMTNEVATMIATGSLLGLLLLLVVLAMLLRGGRANGWAPKDENSNMSIIFTDIESSTSLWSRAPGAMGPALDLHNAIIRRSIKKHKAYEVKTIGDAFMIACQTPEQAVVLATDCQLSLRDADWDKEIDSLYHELHAEQRTGKNNDGNEDCWRGLRVRMGIATGKCTIRLDENTGGYDYFGNTSNLSSRIEAAGHGGQVLMCSDTAAAARSVNAVVVVDLGNQALKGLDDPVPVFQVLPEPLAGRRFPELDLSRSKGLGEYESEVSSNPYTATREGSSHRDNSDVGSDRSAGTAKEGREVLHILLSTVPESDKKSILTMLFAAWRISGKGQGAFHALAERLTAVIKDRWEQDRTVALSPFERSTGSHPTTALIPTHRPSSTPRSDNSHRASEDIGGSRNVPTHDTLELSGRERLTSV